MSEETSAVAGGEEVGKEKEKMEEATTTATTTTTTVEDGKAEVVKAGDGVGAGDGVAAVEGGVDTTTVTTTATTTTAASASTAASSEEKPAAAAAAAAEVALGGELLYSGSVAHSMTGRSGETKAFDGIKDKNLYSFHRLGMLKGVKIAYIITGPLACHSFAVSLEGACFAWGRNEDGQLGLGDTVNRYNPTPLTSFGKGATKTSAVVIKGGACGSTHSLLYTIDGDLYAMGDPKNGKLGIGTVSASVESVMIPNLVDIKNISSVGCGREFSAAVQGSTGRLFMFGNPEFGQLGNGTDGKTLERANKFTFANVFAPSLVVWFEKAGVKIVEVACGANHTCARDEEGKLFTWGFGGYGRLGHKDSKDQHLPVPVELFSFVPPPPNPNIPKFMQRVQPKIRARKITCGATSTYAVIQEPFSTLYMWGITKKAGEATMYPTVVEDLSSYQVQDVASGQTSTIVATANEKMVVTWGPSPTYGELGYGEAKRSSTRAESVTDLAGCGVLQVGMGFGHSLVIVDVSTPAAQAKVDKLKVYEPEELPSLGTAAAAGGSDSKKKRSAASAATEEGEETGAEASTGKAKKKQKKKN